MLLRISWVLVLLIASGAGAAPDDTWAFRAPRRPRVPLVPGGAQPGNPIDAFVLAKLASKGLSPSPRADRRTLIRRATFDLTGLPPTPDEVQTFLADPAPAPRAFAKVVDRLLASPQYGEHWGRHWLDVVRYADTGGGSNDYERPNAWRYRDYVIRSFNQDKPYDRFVQEQLAGDELDPRDPECAIATGFLRMGPWEHTAMSVEAVTRQQWLDDVTNITATAFLGLTAGCARCHDHKFDPIPTRDYYRLQAVFATTFFVERSTRFLTAENVRGFESQAARVQARLERTQERLAELTVKLRPVRTAAGGSLPVEMALDAPDLERERAYRKRLEYYERALQRYSPLSYSVETGRQDDTFVLLRGSLGSPGEKVTPGTLTAVSSEPPPSIPVGPAGRRLALARWIASPNNPLTARVMVNRVWQWHFGRGLVATGSNFGKMGGRPSHPDLLDWLACYFVGGVRSQVLGVRSQVLGVRSQVLGVRSRALRVESRSPRTRHPTPNAQHPTPNTQRPIPNTQHPTPNTDRPWSLKRLHRLIMTSEAYQRTSSVKSADPDNRLLSRFSPRRLEAEALRDGMLAVSGSLNLDAGGPGSFPEINPELAEQPRLIMGSIAPAWEASPEPSSRNRRTVYTFQQRSLINPIVSVFNGANPNDSCERRETSTVAPQVFSLLNSRFSQETALAFAQRLEREAPDGPARVRRAFALAFQREPSAAELSKCLAHLAAMRRQHETFPPPPESPRKPLVRRLIGEFTGALFEIKEESDPNAYEPGPRPSRVSPETRALADLCLVLLNASEFVYVY